MALKSGLSQYKSLGKITNSSLSDEARNLSGRLISAKIVNIDQSGGGSNGTAQVQILDAVEFNNSKVIPNVLPLFPNIKNYPLINEVVLILALANKDYQNDYNNLTFYYLSPLNLWNTPQTNPIPSPGANITPSSQNRGYLEVEKTNSPNKPSAGSNTEFRVGRYFVEKDNINPLYSYEGDFILDGRFGNAIRLGNTVPIKADTLPNNWSSTGKLGDPITIITNGVHNESPSYNSITENINIDKSSIYLTSTQKLPIEVSSTNDYLSYDDSTPPTTPNQYTGEQVVLNSGRLLFNSTTDHILLSSAKSINLNSVESVNVDTLGPFTVEASQVLLGSSLATESAILGDSLIEVLQGIVSDLKIALNLASGQLGNNGVPLEPMGSAFRTVASNLDFYSQQLGATKSNIVKVE